MLLGDESYDLPGIQNAGAIYLFSRDMGGVDNWGLVGRFTAPDADAKANDQFGTSCDIEGSTMVGSGPNFNFTYTYQGAAYVWELELTTNVSVTLVSPTPQAVFAPDDPVHIEATAVPGPGHSVGKVEFYVDEAKIGEDLAAPYSMAWIAPQQAGEYVIEAKAIDETGVGNWSESVTIRIETEPVPRVEITAPVADQVCNTPGTVTIEAAPVVAEECTVDRVEFYQNEVLLGPDATAPYSYAWINPAVGNYTLMAKVYDSAGSNAVSDPVNIRVERVFKVSTTSPTNREINVFWDDPQISATFTSNILAGSVDSETFRVSYFNENPIPGTFDVATNTIRFAPNEQLKPHGRRISITILSGEAGVKCVDGRSLTNDYNWTFYTMPSVTVYAATAQVVDGMDWVQGKASTVRLLPIWWTASDLTSVLGITGKAKVVWDGSVTSETNNFKWYKWDGTIRSKPVELNLENPAYLRGNTAVFSSLRGEVPIFNALGSHTIEASIELKNSKGVPRVFSAQTSVVVKAVARSKPLDIHFIPLDVGEGEFTTGSVHPYLAEMAYRQSLPIRRMYPIATMTHSFETKAPAVYSWGTYLNPLNLKGSQFLSALAKDMDEYREVIGSDVLVGVVPNGWLLKQGKDAAGLAGAKYFNLKDMSVTFVEKDVLPHVTAHEVGHIFAYTIWHAVTHWFEGHSQRQYDFSGFDPYEERHYADDQIARGFAGDFMHIGAADPPFGTVDTWVNGYTYSLLMDAFVAGGASPKKMAEARTVGDALMVGGLLFKSSGACTTLFSRVYALKDKEISVGEDSGDYYAEAFGAGGGLLASLRFDPEFEADAVGNLYAYFRFYFANPAQITRVAVRKAGLELGSQSRSPAPPSLTITAPAGGAVNSPLNIGWTLTGGSASTVFSVFFRNETNAPWLPLSFEQTNRSLIAEAPQVICGSNCQVRILAQDGFNQTEAFSPVFQLNTVPQVLAIYPTNLAERVSRNTDIRVAFSDSMVQPFLLSLAKSNPPPIIFSLPKSEPGDPVPAWNGTALDGRISYDPELRTAVFTPTATLLPDTWHAFWVFPEVANSMGQPLGQTNFIQFKTGSGSLPPEVALTGPATGVVYAADSLLTVSAIASADEDREVSKVSFYADGQNIGEDLSSPYSITWQPSQVGTRMVQAMAMDEEGSVGASEPVYLEIVQSSAAKPIYSHGNPSPDEQALLELINDARENPSAEGLRLAGTADTNVLAAYQAYGVSTNQLKVDFAAYPARPPLAFNSNLMASARRHAGDMATNDFEAQAGSDGSTPSNRIIQAGYSANSWAENIFASAQSVFHGHAGMNVDWSGGPSWSRRINIMNPSNAIYREIGIAEVCTNYPGPATHVGPRVWCCDFGLISGRSFLVGVVFADLDGDQKYDSGEGLAGVNLRTDRGGYSAVSSASGGYAIPLTVSNGVLAVTASGGCLPGDSVKSVALDGQNKRLNFMVLDGSANTQPMVQDDDHFGMRSNRFGFNVNWLSDRVVVVEANTNLNTTNWLRVGTNTLTDGSFYFDDSQWTNHRGRFYRIRSP